MMIIAGPCAVESYDHFMGVGRHLKAEIAASKAHDFYLKGSFDKANRTNVGSNRGAGYEMGLLALRDARKHLGVKTTTDVHECWQVEKTAQAVDLIQIPALLSRQTDLLSAAAASGRDVNVKIGTNMDMKGVEGILSKVPDAWLTYRGTSFGSQLVVDPQMILNIGRLGPRKFILDLTHTNRGDKLFSISLASMFRRFVDGFFAEVHPDPATAHCDSRHQLSYGRFHAILSLVLR